MYDEETGILDLNELRRNHWVVVEAELVRLEYQTSLRATELTQYLRDPEASAE